MSAPSIPAYTAYFQGSTLTAGSVLAALENVSPTEVIKVQRVGILNSSRTTGTATVFTLDKYTPADGSFTIPASIVPHRKGSALPSAILAGSGASTVFTGTVIGTIRSVFWSAAPTTTGGSSTNNDLEAFQDYGVIFDAPYGDTNLQPIVLRTGEAVAVKNSASAAGTVDLWMEFTKE